MNCPLKPCCEELELSCTAAVCHAESEMVPVWPSVVVALAPENCTVPKSASESGVQSARLESHVDGASAIHSALDTSGSVACSVFVNEPPVVEFVSWMVTFEPSTVTLLVMWSPG